MKPYIDLCQILLNYGLNALAKEQYLCVQESFCTHLATIKSTYIYILYIQYHIYKYITPVFFIESHESSIGALIRSGRDRGSGCRIEFHEVRGRSHRSLHRQPVVTEDENHVGSDGEWLSTSGDGFMNLAINLAIGRKHSVHFSPPAR